MNTRVLISIVILTIICFVPGFGQVQLEPVCARSIEVYGVSGYPNSDFVWSVEGGEIISGDGTDTVTIQWGNANGNYRIEVLEITNENCSNFPSEAMIEVKAPYVDLGNDFPEICEGETMTFDVSSYYQDTYAVEWHDGSHAQQYTANQTGEIWVTITDPDGCSNSDTVSLLVNSLPVLNLGNDTTLCDNVELWLLDVGDFSSYQWTSTSDVNYTGNPVFIQPAGILPDTITLDIVDYNQCSASDTIVIYPCDIETLFRDMSNTITPNNDGDNDVWNIPYMDLFENAVLEIFDRWGRLVYRTDKVYEEPWDGTSKGRELPMDSYYYVLQLNTMHAKPITGTVNLIR